MNQDEEREKHHDELDPTVSRITTVEDDDE